MVLIYLLTNYCSQLAVCTSAYPIHYRLALAFYTILSNRTIKVCQTPLAANYETCSAMLPRSHKMAFIGLDSIYIPRQYFH